MFANIEQDDQYSFDTKIQLGFLAQELELTLPTKLKEGVIDTSSEGYLGVKYNRIVPLLVGATQQQSKAISETAVNLDATKEDLRVLKAAYDGLKQTVRRLSEALDDMNAR